MTALSAPRGLAPSTPRFGARHRLAGGAGRAALASRIGAVAPVARGRRAIAPTAFVPNMIPNPAYRWGDDNNPNAPSKCSLDDMLAAKHAKWQVGHERGADETDTIWRKFRCRDDKAGHAFLEALQGELYVSNEQGCRIRRETQGMFYMCCDGVRVRLNEPKNEVLVEVPLPMETFGELDACEKTLADVERVAAGARAR